MEFQRKCFKIGTMRHAKDEKKVGKLVCLQHEMDRNKNTRCLGTNLNFQPKGHRFRGTEPGKESKSI